MSSLYLECNMGAAGDMLCAALFELCDAAARAHFLSVMNALLPGVAVAAIPETKCGIRGTRITVTINGGEETPGDAHAHGHEHAHTQEHSHEHRALTDIRALIEGLELPDGVKRDALAVYALLAQAEAAVHGRDVELVHFHEVGALDAVADIVGCCLLLHLLGVRKILASPIHVGSGSVHTSHGVLPVPAPATARLLLGIPVYSDGTRGELCTPTGAALLKHFVSEFTALPAIEVQRIGYGMGKKDFPAANCVRAFLFQRDAANGPNGSAVELRCNVDDMTPEAVGCATQALLEQGAKDVYVQHVLMKKNRPGFVIVCICAQADADRLAAAMLLHTSTIGVRRFPCERYMMDRCCETIATDLGEVRIKRAKGYSVVRVKPEYEDVARLAREHGLSFEQSRARIERQIT